MDSTEAIAGMPVRFGWMKTWQTNMLIAPRPAGLISPTYRIDPRAVHHALTVSEPRTADSVLWRRDRQSVWLSPVISVAPRQKSSDTDRHPGDAGGLALCQIADLLAFASLWHPRAAANHNDQRRVYWAEAGATCQSSWP